MAMTFEIDGRRIGPGHEPFLILEVGINHNGDMDQVKKMIDVAANSGADAVKFQTFRAAEFVSDPLATYTYQSQGRQVTESMLGMFQRYELSPDQWKQIVLWCEQSKIMFFSTPQNPSDLDFLLKTTRLPAIKVGSDDLTNIGLMRYYASKSLPMIISAGMAYLSEIESAVRAIRETGNSRLAVLHCVSSYPAPAEDLHLNKMATISRAFDVPVGFSDHTVGPLGAVAAVAMGACIVEKHFTLDKNLPGPDHRFSADPREVKEWVHAIRNTYRSLGQSIVEPTTDEMEMRKIARRSVVAARDLAQGEILKLEDLAFKRPGTGIPPAHVSYLVGHRVRRDLRKDDLVTFEALR
jgi:N-acetylneuraminate synthase/N,N'-diacetyllegionaminate synthase